MLTIFVSVRFNTYVKKLHISYEVCLITKNLLNSSTYDKIELQKTIITKRLDNCI